MECFETSNQFFYALQLKSMSKRICFYLHYQIISLNNSISSQLNGEMIKYKKCLFRHALLLKNEKELCKVWC